METKIDGAGDHAVQRDAGDRDLNVIAVNDNGRALLQWFRALPIDQQTQVFTVATQAAAKLRH
jgi:hypothetical protein